MLGSLIVYLKGMRIMMFQLSGFYYSWFNISGLGFRISFFGRVMVSDSFLGFRVSSVII